ncbi:MAG TPA: sigma-70 family RNA polymerase sigma factor [Polyangiaceae bacterium]|nr:sigma-70 family RNA polymerase sigma factor [Polyangiaceae bacterium]
MTTADAAGLGKPELAPPDIAQLETHRVALTGHCYRMLGSAVDADDAVQETMVRAWKSMERFEGRSALRTWLYRIATNVCLDALADGRRRARSIDEGPMGTVDDVLEVRPRTHWLEPIPDARAVPADADPAEKALLRQSIRLAFVAALQHLPAKQRAALLLTEVVGCSAAEVAASLDTSVAAVNSALQRARATLAAKSQSTEPSPEPVQPAVVDRYVAAFERYDMDALMSLLHQDAIISMPPFTLWLTGHDTLRTWLLGRGEGCRGSRLLRSAANGLPAFGQYRRSPDDGRHRAWALIVLEGDGERITGMTNFLDAEHLFPLFGFPPELP